MRLPVPRAAAALLLASALLSACRHEAATGDADDIVVGAQKDVWTKVQSRLKSKLEPSRIAHARKDFTVVWQDPAKPEWEQQRKARQLLLIGTAKDPWVSDALSHAQGSVPAAPAIVEVEDVWSKPQQVTVLALPEGDARAAVYAKLDSLRARLEERYRKTVIAEMFESGQNPALGDSLLDQSGFTVSVPRDWVYKKQRDIFTFRKTVDSAKVTKQVTITWKTPIPAGLQGSGLAAWRAEAEAASGTQQTVDLDQVDASRTTHRGNVAYQLLGPWQGKGKASGPFILRAIFCPTQDRVYLLDGWLSAPAQEQHHDLVELESILNSFRCGSARSSQPNE
jgi:hypothetical protein